MNKEKIQYAFFKAYTKPLPFYRILLYSFDENAEWYRQRVKKYLK